MRWIILIFLLYFSFFSLSANEIEALSPQSLIGNKETIGQGEYRTVLQKGDYVLKKINKFRAKNYFLFSINYPIQFYTFFKFGIRDFNLHEWKNFINFISHVDPVMKPYFAKIYGVIRHKNESLQISEAVKDFDGTVSKSLEDLGYVDDPNFWECMDQLIQYLVN